MVLTFANNSLHLVNWGFSFGDVAALAGAGRHVITWLTAEPRDAALLDFLKVTASDLGFRRGLVDPVALNRRWSHRIALLRDGQRIEVQPEGPEKELENINRFTGIMTIIVVCLDEVVTNNTLRKIIIAFSEIMLASSTLKTEYLSHEIPEHIQGWRSTGATRMMVPRARDIWNTLETQKLHLPGFAPDSESEEIVRFLEWIVLGESRTYITASTDIYSLAMLLSQMGFDSLRTGSVDTILPESYAMVVLDDRTIQPNAVPAVAAKRRGMRIPLNNMEESVSLWPGTPEENNRRRMIFKIGKKVAAGVVLQAVYHETDIGIMFSSLNPMTGRTSDSEINSLAEQYLPLVNDKAIHGLTKLVNIWRLHPVKREMILSSLADEPIGDIQAAEYDECKGDLQIFLLGYYYGILNAVIDTSQLGLKEAFGSWGWYDSKFFKRMAAFVKCGVKRDMKGNPLPGIRYERFQFFKIAAYLLVGAEDHVIDGINHGVIGLHGKLTITTSMLLGNADSPDKIVKLCLLDIDPTAIPSDGLGMIKPGPQAKVVTEDPTFTQSESSITMPYHKLESDDFTSHIEPAWSYDSNLCLVAYRHKGRLVHKINPWQAEVAILK